MRRVLAIAVLLVALGAAAPAHATSTTVAASPADAALVPLQTEIMLLVELKALATPLPARVRQVHDDWVSYAKGQTRAQLLSWFDDVDGKGTAALTALRAASGPPSVQVATALGSLGQRDRASLQQGERIGIAPAVYERALADLTERDGRALPAGAATTASAADGAQAPLPSGLVAALGAVLAIAVTGMGWALTRRSIARHGSLGRTTVDDLLDAGRRLTAATDRVGVIAVAVTDAVAMTTATTGAFVTRGGDGTAHVDAPHPLMPADLMRGPIARALETGQTARSHRPGRALLAVPVIHDGAVLGALAVVRPTPFTTVESGVLDRLAPLVAGALHAAVQHDEDAELAYVDALTAVGNRRRFERDLDELASDGQTLVVAMVDVDHFKAFNDRHGHRSGDQALQLVAEALRTCVRRRDLVYRYGGEEFAILLPSASTIDATAIADRIRIALRDASPPCDDQPPCALTVSIGVASRADDDPRATVARADEALYEAKRTGRDRVVVAA